jgi:CubicO group peptidase (beta-lactamase class C family)
MSDGTNTPSNTPKLVGGLIALLLIVGVAGFGVPAILGMLEGDAWIEHDFTKGQRRALTNHMMEGTVPQPELGGVAGGALALIHHGEFIMKTSFGYADVDAKTPFTTSQPVRLASASKPITATVLLVLHDKGLLDIDEPIDSYLPELKRIKIQDGGVATRAPTIRECFSHMGGLPPNKDVDDDRRQQLFSTGPDTIVRALGRFGLSHNPGTKEVYSGIGYIVAARVSEVLLQMDFEGVMIQELLKPLGMTKTTFRPTQDLIDQMPTLYNLEKWGFDPQPPPPVGGEINPAGGLLSTLDDMAVFYQLHARRGAYDGGRLLSQDTIEQMYMAQSKSGEHGLGFNTDENKGKGAPAGTVMHGGKTGTYAWLDFDNDLVGILLTQTSTTGNREFRFKLVDMITQFADKLPENQGRPRSGNGGGGKGGKRKAH